MDQLIFSDERKMVIIEDKTGDLHVIEKSGGKPGFLMGFSVFGTDRSPVTFEIHTTDEGWDTKVSGEGETWQPKVCPS